MKHWTTWLVLIALLTVLASSAVVVLPDDKHDQVLEVALTLAGTVSAIAAYMRRVPRLEARVKKLEHYLADSMGEAELFKTKHAALHVARTPTHKEP